MHERQNKNGILISKQCRYACVRVAIDKPISHTASSPSFFRLSPIFYCFTISYLENEAMGNIIEQATVKFQCQQPSV